VTEPDSSRKSPHRRQRLFLAFDVPRSIRVDVDEAIEPWRASIQGARWVPVANWHVTLKFLGQTDPDGRRWIQDRIGDIASGAAPFSTRVEGLGCFPDAGRARVVWAGLRGGVDAASAVAVAIDRSLAARFEPETREFTPHLTLARLDRPRRVPPAFVSTQVSSDPFEVDRVVLYRSHPGRPAPRYEVLWSCPLTGAAT
jgi:2'-5' RNA ligase